MQQDLAQISAQKEQLGRATTDEQIVIARILLDSIQLKEVYLKTESTDKVSDLVKDVTSFFATSSDATKLGIVSAISSSLFQALIGQKNNTDNPTEQFKKEYLAKLLIDRVEGLLDEPFEDSEQEVQLLSAFLREIWGDSLENEIPLEPRYSPYRNFWAFVFKYQLGTQDQRERLLDEIN